MSEIAQLLGSTSYTVRRWCERLGIPIAHCPVRGVPGATAPGHWPARSPWYVTTTCAASLIEAMMPGLANAAARKAAQVRLGRQALARRKASANVTNEVMWATPGGTGSGGTHTETTPDPQPQTLASRVT